ncbi:MAG: hypothetical protein V8S77_08865 [Oscillospiraceae bacterium]
MERGAGFLLLHQKKNHYLRIGLAITAVITAMALVGCFWTPYTPTAMSGSEKFAAPSLRHLSVRTISAGIFSAGSWWAPAPPSSSAPAP